MSRRWTLLWLLLLTTLAAVPRFWQLDQLPPGLWFDEGWVSVVARDGGAQVYFPASFGGMHPAVVYLTRLAQQLTPSPLAIRYALAAVGTLCIPLAYFAFRAIFALDEENDHWSRGKGQWSMVDKTRPYVPPFLAAFALTILYPFFHFSRLGFESLLPVPAALLAFWLLARQFTIHNSQFTSHKLPSTTHHLPRPPVLLAIILGLSLYTFDTGRFIPIAVAAGYWLLWWVYRPFDLRRALRDFALLVGIALLVAGPLLGYFWLNLDQFTGRAAVTTYNTLGAGADSVPLALLSNLGRTLGGLSLPGWGDEIARHNLPGRPVFDLGLSFLFWIGVGSAVWRWRRPASLLLLVWLGVGLLPVILTDGAPTYTRLFVAAPALAGFVALGGRTLVRWRPAGGGGIVLVCLLVGLGSTIGDYFGRWASDPALFDDFMVGRWEAAHLARDLSREWPTYFVPDHPYLAEPTFDLLLADSPVRRLPESPCLVLPPAGEAAAYVVDLRADPTYAVRLREIYPEALAAAAVRYPPTGEGIYRQIFVPAGAAEALPGELRTAVFGEQIALERWRWLPEEQMIELAWRAEEAPAEDYTLFVHLYPAGESDRPPVLQVDVQPCEPTGRWRTGERIVDRLSWAPPADLPAGRYTVALGWYAFPSFERLPLSTAASSSLSDNRLSLFTLTIDP